MTKINWRERAAAYEVKLTEAHEKLDRLKAFSRLRLVDGRLEGMDPGEMRVAIEGLGELSAP
jgi:hypothetical protein